MPPAWPRMCTVRNWTQWCSSSQISGQSMLITSPRCFFTTTLDLMRGSLYKLKVSRHPRYSTDLASTDFYFWPNLVNFLAGKIFNYPRGSIKCLWTVCWLMFTYLLEGEHWKINTALAKIHIHKIHILTERNECLFEKNTLTFCITKWQIHR